MNNHLKTVVLLSALTALFGAIGYALAGSSGLVVALGLAAVMNLGTWWFSDRIVLKLYGAKPMTPNHESGVHAIVERLAAAQGIPTPAVYLLPQAAPNAFATGRSPQHAAVAVTSGLLELLNKKELEGVLGHELGHIANRDTLVSTIAATLAGALSMLADMAFWGQALGHRSDDDHPHPAVGIIGLMLAPIAGFLIQSAVSRSREFLADEHGARATGDPLALASALQKIEAWSKKVPLTAATPATAHLFIVNPFTARKVLELFSTHPPTRERVKRLERLAYPNTFVA